jgi:hypothetical protein
VGFQTTSGTVSLYDWYDTTWNDPLVPGSHYFHYLNPQQALAIYNNAAFYDYVTTISATEVPRIPMGPPVLPAISPGPTIAGPGAPVVPGALPPGAPGAADVAGTAVPGAAGDSLTEIFVPEPSTQVAAQGGSATGTTSEGEALAAGSAAGTTSGSAANPLAFDTATGTFLVFAGGRGDALEEERRRR